MEKFNISKIVANFIRKGRFSKEKRPFYGAATQIRTGDLILTNGNDGVFFHLIP